MVTTTKRQQSEHSSIFKTWGGLDLHGEGDDMLPGWLGVETTTDANSVYRSARTRFPKSGDTRVLTLDIDAKLEEISAFLTCQSTRCKRRYAYTPSVHLIYC